MPELRFGQASQIRPFASRARRIAGTAWDLGRAYAEKGGSGFGVRLLVELAGAGR